MNDRVQDKFNFYVDGKEFIEFDNTKPSRFGREIMVTAEIPGEYQLFLEVEGDEPDMLISDDATVSLSGPTKHFYAVPPAAFGQQ